MDGRNQQADNRVLSTGTLNKGGGTYEVVLQTAKDIPQIISLQDTVYDTLPEEQKTFMLRKKPEALEAHFASGSLAVGIVHNGTLIGQGRLGLPSQDYKSVRGTANFMQGAALQTIAILEGMLVHPGYRGNNLMSIMVDARLGLAQAAGRENAVTESSVDNPHSWSVLLKEGLKIRAIDVDPEDGTMLYYMHARVTPLMEQRAKGAFAQAAAHPVINVPAKDLQAQKSLLSQGFKGVSYDAKNRSIGFHRNPNLARLNLAGLAKTG
jgi:hypothetical protein